MGLSLRIVRTSVHEACGRVNRGFVIFGQLRFWALNGSYWAWAHGCYIKMRCKTQKQKREKYDRLLYIYIYIYIYRKQNIYG